MYAALTVKKKLMHVAVARRRSVRLRVRGSAKRIRSIRITQNGRRVARFKGKRKRVSLTGLADGAAQARVVVQLSNGKRRTLRVQLPACSAAA